MSIPIHINDVVKDDVFLGVKYLISNDAGYIQSPLNNKSVIDKLSTEYEIFIIKCDDEYWWIKISCNENIIKIEDECLFLINQYTIDDIESIKPLKDNRLINILN